LIPSKIAPIPSRNMPENSAKTMRSKKLVDVYDLILPHIREVAHCPVIVNVCVTLRPATLKRYLEYFLRKACTRSFLQDIPPLQASGRMMKDFLKNFSGNVTCSTWVSTRCISPFQTHQSKKKRYKHTLSKMLHDF